MHHAIGIGHDHAFAVRAGKIAVVYRFDARLADLVAAFVIGACGRVVQNAIGNRAHVAKHLARKGLVRVYAMRALLHIDARECIGVLSDERHIAASRRRRHLALRLGASRRIFDALAHNGIGQTKQGGQTQKRHTIVGHIGVGQHGGTRFVVDHHDALRIENTTARGGRFNGCVLILVGCFHILLVREHLHAPQLRRKAAKYGRNEHADSHEARFQSLAHTAGRSTHGRTRAHRRRARACLEWRG